jgi:hypothetical protein
MVGFFDVCVMVLVSVAVYMLLRTFVDDFFFSDCGKGDTRKSNVRNKHDHADETQNDADVTSKAPNSLAANTTVNTPHAVPNALRLFDCVNESEESCEHIIWFTRCEGDTYQLAVNGVQVALGSQQELDIAHGAQYSSLAVMTREKIEFPFTLEVRVYREKQLIGAGRTNVQRLNEPLPE